MKRLAIVLLVLMILAVPSGMALAQPNNTVIERNETVNNDVIVFDGDLEIEDGAVVNGDVVVFNGDTDLAGTINGDVVLFNGDLDATGGATISGDCVLVNGDLDDDSVGGVRCSQVQALALGGLLEDLPVMPPFAPVMPDMPEMPKMPDMPDMPEMPAVPSPRVPDVPPTAHRTVNRGADFAGIAGSTLLMGLLAFGVGAVFPRHLRQVMHTARRKPLASGAVGVLTAVAVPSIAVLLAIFSALLLIICIGLLGFPLVFLLLFALAAGGVMGWIAVGAWLGERLFGRKARRLSVTAALGTMLLTLGLGLLGLIPFVFGESVLAFIIASIGLGAVALTQFGRKPYPRGAGGRSPEPEPDIEEDEVKVTAVLDTLPDEDDEPTTFKA